MRLILTLLLLCLMPATVRAQALAFQDKSPGYQLSDHSYQFLALCPGKSRSPDGRFALVQKAYEEGQELPVELQDSRGKTLTRLPSLSDAMPFSVTWAPNSRWFFVNHHVGSFMDVLQIFEITGNTAVERPALVTAAAREAKRRYPCLPEGMILPNGAQWSRDSRRIIMVTVSAPYACTEFGEQPGDWENLWMIGDVTTGRVDLNSVRVQPDGKPFRIPQDSAYAGF